MTDLLNPMKGHTMMDTTDGWGRRTGGRFDREDDEVRTLVRWVPRLPTKVSLLMALSLVTVAVYYLWAPVFMDTASGWFPCGSVMASPGDEFTSNICRTATDVNKYKAFAAGALALVVGGGGVLFFGGDKRAESRRAPRRDDDVDLPQDVEVKSLRGARRDADRSTSGSSSQRSTERRSDPARSRRPRERDAWVEDGWR